MQLEVSQCLSFALFFHLAKSQFDTGMSEDRRVIVQLFEWPFDDIKEECKNVLGPQKFGGVLVQPVTEHLLVRSSGKVERPWWERYQPVSWKISSRLGTEQQFKQMVEECNKNNVRVYVDVVLNHGVSSMNGEVEGVGGTHANAKTKDYPGFGYSKTNFHESCPIDYKNKISVRVCELDSLQDVDQSQQYVRDKIVAFLNKLIDFGVAGFRIDAAKHMWPEDLRAIYGQLHDVSLDGGKVHFRPLWLLEVNDEDGSYQEDYKDIGSEYDFELIGRAFNCFKSGTASLSSIYEYAKNPRYLSKTVQALASDHDLQRKNWENGFWESPDRSGVQQIINAFLLTFSRNTPSIFSGYKYTDKDSGPPSDASQNIISPLNCNNGWMCEHRFEPLKWVMKFFTNYVKDEPIESWWSNWDGGSPQQAAFTRGQKGFAVFNADSKALDHTFKVSLPAGIYCDLATGFFCHHHQMCMGKGGMKRKVEVKSDGTVKVHLPGMSRSHSFGVGDDTMPEPPYLILSTESKYPPAEEPNATLEIVGWVILGVAIVVAVVLVARFLLNQSKSSKAIHVQV